MDSEHWNRIQTLFLDASEKPKSDQRAFLETACGSDHDLLAEVLALLEEDRRPDSLLDRDFATVVSQAIGTPPSAPGQFGPYRIVRVLGQGGMGIVYLAERPDLGSQVAIKFLRDAWMSPARRDRFAMEQRTLARLNHPGIASLHDAGVLSDGTPWFVMEYVDGLPIDEYCRSSQNTIEERLALFRSVCRAVQYAHQHAVIHRDLKPSNILVKADGAVRLLDFGIAKQLDSLDQPADQTRTELRLMTPAYAAPEQLRGDPVGVFTDIYALGVILYELLAGEKPFDLSNRTPGESERMIIECEPQRPSALGCLLSNASRGAWADLDVLCLTAMHKDPRRRYASVEAMLRDIDHYLNQEPLDARPDSFRYRLGKFLVRHRRAVSSTALTAAAVVALVVFFTIRLRDARDAALAAASRTDRIQRFMLNLFEGGISPPVPPATCGSSHYSIAAFRKRRA